MGGGDLWHRALLAELTGFTSRKDKIALMFQDFKCCDPIREDPGALACRCGPRAAARATFQHHLWSDVTLLLGCTDAIYWGKSSGTHQLFSTHVLEFLNKAAG